MDVEERAERETWDFEVYLENQMPPLVVSADEVVYPDGEYRYYRFEVQEATVACFSADRVVGVVRGD